jgi:hypothetical protein
VSFGQVNLNNNGGLYDGLINFVSYPPNYPSYPGATAQDRYYTLTITSQQAQDIANNSPDGFIDFSFDCACIWSGGSQNCVGSPIGTPSCHTDITWVRLIKDMGLATEEVMYNDCPNGNFIEDFDPCGTTPA